MRCSAQHSGHFSWLSAKRWRSGQVKKHNDETGTVPVFFIAKSNQQSKEDQSFFGLLYHSALTITQRSPKRPM
jgi:hypothetical protein